MSDQLAAAAAALNVPETLVQRSAEARAKASGGFVDDILAAWAGGESAPEPSTPTPSESPSESSSESGSESASEAQPEPTSEPAPVPEPVAATPTSPAAPAATPAAPTPPPAPETVTPEEALSHPVVVSVPTAGLKERTSGALPRWMAAAFMLVPMFGLLYLTSNIQSTGCVDGGFELAIDRVTGNSENCDGSAFEGRGAAGGAGATFIAQGRDLYTSDGCAGCHGASGQGGQGPAFANVLLTFGSCADHIEWVRLGSAGFQAAGNSTYGDVAKPINGGMPAHGSLSQEQLASVVTFERVVFGGGNADEVLTDCGLVTPPDGGDSTDSSTVTTVGEAEASVGATG